MLHFPFSSIFWDISIRNAVWNQSGNCMTSCWAGRQVRTCKWKCKYEGKNIWGDSNLYSIGATSNQSTHQEPCCLFQNILIYPWKPICFTFIHTIICFCDLTYWKNLAMHLCLRDQKESQGKFELSGPTASPSLVKQNSSQHIYRRQSAKQYPHFSVPWSKTDMPRHPCAHTREDFSLCL